jgi:hypothetical protein
MEALLAFHTHLANPQPATAGFYFGGDPPPGGLVRVPGPGLARGGQLTVFAVWHKTNDLTSLKDSQPRFTLRVPCMHRSATSAHESPPKKSSPHFAHSSRSPSITNTRCGSVDCFRPAGSRPFLLNHSWT